jgi:hypothetical protein
MAAQLFPDFIVITMEGRPISPENRHRDGAWHHREPIMNAS